MTSTEAEVYHVVTHTWPTPIGAAESAELQISRTAIQLDARRSFAK